MATALVLSAGGMFAAWEAGVWRAIHNRFQPDVVVGASAGAFNGWCIAGGCSPDDLIRDWLDPRTATLLQPGFTFGGIVSPEPLHRKARELFERYRPRIPFGLTIVELRGMRVRLVRDSEITWRHLAATCSIPLALPPVRIAGKACVDGGFLGALPLWAAEEMGAREAVALNVLTSMPFRAWRRIARPRPPGAALVVKRIEPSEALGGLIDSVRWTRANIERWIELGENDGFAALRSITI